MFRGFPLRVDIRPSACTENFCLACGAERAYAKGMVCPAHCMSPGRRDGPRGGAQSDAYTEAVTVGHGVLAAGAAGIFGKRGPTV